jgi:ABC-type multidrug transport system permease subunit
MVSSDSREDGMSLDLPTAFLQEAPRIKTHATVSAEGWGWLGIRTIAWKEWLQLKRDRYLLGFLVGLPLAQFLIMGLAIQKELREIPTAVCNFDYRNHSWDLLKVFESSPTFKLADDPGLRSEADLVKAVQKGKYKVGLVIPPDFSRQVLQGALGKVPIRLVVDGTNANLTKSILEAAQSSTARFAQLTAEKTLLPNGRPLALQLETLNSPDSDSPDSQATALVLAPLAQGAPSIQAQIINNPDLSPSLFLIPGILGIIMHILTVLLTSFSVVRERESGTLEQLMVSPLKPGELMLGKILPYALIGFADMALTLVLMMGVFKITIEGSFWFLSLGSILFILTSLGVGLVFSTVCRTQVQAVQLTLGLLLPSLMLSGFVFPLDPMPWAVKGISLLMPITHYLDIIRGVVIKGLSFADLWRPMLGLFLLTLLSFTLSIARFKKQLA